jgi:hypothetical protein
MKSDKHSEKFSNTKEPMNLYYFSSKNREDFYSVDKNSMNKGLRKWKDSGFKE